MVAMTIPATLDALTPEWLTQALRAGGQIGDASVISVEKESIGQGVGILCRLARLSLRYDNSSTAPRTLVAKMPSLDPQTRGMVSLFRFYEREVRFYEQVAGQIDIHTPRCYYSAFDSAGGDFVLLLEDLTVSRIGDQLASCSLAEAELVLAELARLHATWWNSPRLAALDWMPLSSDPVNKAGLALYPQAWGPFVERFGHALPAPMLSIGEKLGTRVNDMLDRFVAGPRTICHGDPRLDNFFFGDGATGPALTVIDWQIAIRSVGTYDVGYFMSQSLDPSVRRAKEQNLLKHYHDVLCGGGVTDYSFDQCLGDYRWTVLFCFCYPVMSGGLGDLSNERGYALAKAMTERSAAAIMDWNAGELLDE